MSTIFEYFETIVGSTDLAPHGADFCYAASCALVLFIYWFIYWVMKNIFGRNGIGR